MRAIAALLCLALALAARAQEPAPSTPEAGRVTFGMPLVIGPTGPSARAVILPDRIGAAIVEGTFRPPLAGDRVELPDGKPAEWAEPKIDDKGLIKHEALRGGGYVYLPVDLDFEFSGWVLAASGHAMVYVNGEPRTGDPYGFGNVRLPVHLRKGRNDLLFRAGREAQIRVAITPAPPSSPVFIDTGDCTLPDLVRGEGGDFLAGVLIVNASTAWQRGWTVLARVGEADAVDNPVAPLAPLSTRKIPVRFRGGAQDAEPRLNLRLVLRGDHSADAESAASVNLRLRSATETRKITFLSGIDGSVQYYALRPAAVPAGASAENLPLVLSLHGASVEATGQADAYAPKDWCNLVAPTNRRAYGFDWEDWGRLDALEVLAHATAALKPDPRRVYLTGHSMGGHGTWQIGAHFPGTFAAIAPSAGWVDFWGYSGAMKYDGDSPVEKVLARAASPSDTLALKGNYANGGVYILHGDADDNVPVDQARRMRQELGAFHPDFAYHEQPGAGHWWGNACVDWPPLMEFLKARSRPAPKDIHRVRFATSTPAISATMDWATIEEQREQLRPSGVDLTLDPKKRAFRGTTENVAILTLDLSVLEPGEPFTVSLDGAEGEPEAWPRGQTRWTIGRGAEGWRFVAGLPPSFKNPARAGLFKNAFTNHVLLVVGTAGTEEENAWALAKARYDAETFWYRGNGSLPIVLDSEFDAAAEPDRNIVLYGNAETNRAWGELLGDSPIQVRRGVIIAGERRFPGPDLGCLLIRPRPGSDVASVGAVCGTGAPGMRLASRVPYFVSGVGLPDWLILGPEALTTVGGGVLGAGFFGNDWTLSPADSGWSAPAGP